MSIEEFRYKVADLIEVVDLYGYEFLEDEREISDLLNQVLEKLNK